MGDSGFEPLTSSASRKYDSLLELSRACRTPANCHISALTHSLAFQEIYSGCCTVAAPNFLWMTLRTFSGGFPYYPLSTFNLSYDSQTVLNVFHFALYATAAIIAGRLFILLRRSIFRL